MKFDYIICHGVFSWISKKTQEEILKIIQNHLSPNGISFISYNTYPGWHIKDDLKKLVSLNHRDQTVTLDYINSSNTIFRYSRQKCG